MKEWGLSEMIVEGVVYVFNKRSRKGSWTEYYVKIPAREARRMNLKHKQRVYVSTVEPTVENNELLNLLTKLFLLCFRDRKLAGLIVSNPERADLVRKIVDVIKKRGEVS